MFKPQTKRETTEKSDAVLIMCISFPEIPALIFCSYERSTPRNVIVVYRIIRRQNTTDVSKP
jgi:hypothetical protein